MQIMKIISYDMGVNSYVVYNEDNNEAVIIDPSFEAHKIENAVSNDGLKPVAILLTHGHFDHIAGVCRIRNRYNIPVYIEANDADMLIDAKLNLSQGFGEEITCNKADKIIHDGDKLSLAGMVFEVISTPGHTKGGVTYKVNNVLFTGDTLFNMSIGRTDFPGGDFSQMMQSLSKLASLDEMQDYTVNPGHGQSTSLDYEVTNNPFMS